MWNCLFSAVNVLYCNVVSSSLLEHIKIRTADLQVYRGRHKLFVARHTRPFSIWVLVCRATRRLYFHVLIRFAHQIHSFWSAAVLVVRLQSPDGGTVSGSQIYITYDINLISGPAESLKTQQFYRIYYFNGHGADELDEHAQHCSYFGHQTVEVKASLVCKMGSYLNLSWALLVDVPLPSWAGYMGGSW